MLHILLRHPGRGVRDVSQDDHGPSLLDVLRPDAVSHLVGRVPVHAQGVAPLDGNLGNGWAHSDRLEVKLKRKSSNDPFEYKIQKAYFASKGEVGVTEEADSDDRSAEQLRRVNVGHDAAPRHVVIDNSGVNPASPHHSGLLYGPDDQLSDPVRDVVHLPSGI